MYNLDKIRSIIEKSIKIAADKHGPMRGVFQGDIKDRAKQHKRTDVLVTNRD